MLPLQNAAVPYMRHLIAILRQLEERKVCKSCRKCSSDVFFLPCGHLCCCVECSETIYNCPLCKCAVIERIKTFVD